MGWLSGNMMSGVNAAFSSGNIGSLPPGEASPHSNPTFINDVDAFVKAFLSSSGDTSDLVNEFINNMSKKEYK